MPAFVAFRRIASRPALATSVASAVAALAGAGCASIEVSTAPDATTRHAVSITRHATIPGAPSAVFAAVVAEDVLPKVLTGYGPLPAVVGTSDRSGPWDVPGSRRTVHLADGSTLSEAVTEFVPTERFAYRVGDFTHPVLRALATEGRGQWRFAPVEGGTAVEWTYTFEARGAAAAVPLSGVVQWLWRGYMDACLANFRTMAGG